MSRSQPTAAQRRVRDGHTLVREIESSAQSKLHEQGDARSRFAAAFGFALVGERSSVWLSGRELRTCLDLLADAVTQRVPLVIYLELETDHSPAYLAADSGVPVALAGTVQSTLDWSVVMRRAGEESLLPSVVAFEQLSCGRSPADLIWPGDPSIHQYLGSVDQSRATTPGPEETLLGKTRRAVPTWFDPDRPLSLCVGTDPWTKSAGRAAAQVHLDPVVLTATESARIAWTTVTGRDLCGLRTHEATGSRERTILTTGPAFETVVEGLGETASVVAIEQLAPLLRPELKEDGTQKVVWILDRSPASFEGCSPLPRLLGLHETDSSNPAARDGRRGGALRRLLNRPRAEGRKLRYAIWGLGGEPLRPLDVAQLPTAEADDRHTVYLGQDFVPSGLIEQPHREAYFDGLRRDHPELDRIGLKANPTMQNQAGEERRDTILLRFESEPPELTEDLLGTLDFVSGILGYHLREVPLFPGGQFFRSFKLWPAETERPTMEEGRGAVPDLIISADEEGRDLVRLRDGSSLAAPPEAAPTPIVFVESVLPRTSRAALVLEGLRRARVDLEKSLGDAEVRARLSHATNDDELHARQQWIETVLLSTRETMVLSTPAADSAQSTSSRRTLIADPRDGIRRLPADGTIIDPARFRNQIAEVWNKQTIDPEPGVAAPTLPPWTGSLWNARGAETEPWPEFRPDACTVCGDCWSTCPEGAFNVRWIDGASLVRRWTERAQSTDLDVSPLRRAGRSLAAAMNAPSSDPNAAEGAEVADTTNDVNAFTALTRALTTWAKKSPKNSDAEPALRDLLQSVSAEFSQIPLSQPRTVDGEPVNGIVYSSLAIDPDICTGCGLCAWICPSNAFDPNGTLENNHHAVFAAVADLPDPDTEALERIQTVYGRTTASMTLSSIEHSFAGRPRAPGSGQASALHLVLAALEPKSEVNRCLEELNQLQAGVAERIEREVGRAVAPAEFDRMGQALETTGPDALDLQHLADGLEKANRDGRLDAEGLAHGVEVGRQLANLRWKLESASGIGRRPYGLVLGPGLDWAATFPDNPVAAPVWNAQNSAFLSMARGLVAAEVERSGREVTWLRCAREIVGGQNLATSSRSAETATVTVPYAERSEEERVLGPRIVVVVDETAWTPTRRDLEPLLTDGGPVWVVLLAQASPGSEESNPDQSFIRTLAGGDAWALQSSPAAPRHLSAALSRMTESPKPAILRLLVAEPASPEFTTTSEPQVDRVNLAWNQIQSELESGAFPLGLWDPDGTQARVAADPRLGETVCASAVGAAKVIPSAEVTELHAKIRSLQEELVATSQRVREETELELVGRLARRLGQVSRKAQSGQASENGETPR